MSDYSFYEDFKHGEEYEKSLIFVDRFTDLDACFATSDAFGFALYRIYSSRRKMINIITYDGCMGSLIQQPVFTTIEQNIVKMGKLVVDVLLRKIKHEEVESTYIVKTNFIKGETA